MPNLIFHSVWNLSPTISVGNNPLHDSSFGEQLGSGKYHIVKNVRSLGLQYLTDIDKQISESITDQHILNYRPPKSATAAYNSDCLEDTQYNWSFLKKKKKNKKH